MATDDNRPLLRVSDMARELRLSQSRIYGLIHAGAIPATRVGGRLVVRARPGPGGSSSAPTKRWRPSRTTPRRLPDREPPCGRVRDRRAPAPARCAR
jgi:excisionase family DNA binding protein